MCSSVQFKRCRLPQKIIFAIKLSPGTIEEVVKRFYERLRLPYLALSLTLIGH